MIWLSFFVSRKPIPVHIQVPIMAPTRRELLAGSSGLMLSTFTGCLTLCGSNHSTFIRAQPVSDSTVEDDQSVRPISFSDLTASEQELLRTAIKDGEWRTCDENPGGDVFDRFLSRVDDHRNQSSQDPYIEYDGTYYALFVKEEDIYYATFPPSVSE